MSKHDHRADEFFMQRAMELALLGRGRVSPNPLVGCVVVHGDKIIGEGWHERYGGPHAEVNAVGSVTNTELLKESAIYVNLEPCSHFGKTPPCADMLIRHEVKRVVVANGDTNTLVNGQGLHKLRAAGVELVIGILDKAGRELNRRFFTFVERQRPYVILKWAETANGFIARKNFDSKWISDEFSRQLVHKMRAEEDAVLVGCRTAQLDNPELTVRDWTGRNPIRIVIDRFLKVKGKLKLFDRTQPTLVYNVLQNEEQKNVALIKLGEEDFLAQLIQDLYKRNIQSVIVEGGAFTLQSFIDAGLWDEAYVFISPQTFDEGIKAPTISGTLQSHHKIENDWLKILRHDNYNGVPTRMP